MSEAIYDEQIAPLLKRAAEICNEHGLSITAMVEFAPREVGLTLNGPPDPDITGAAFYLAYYAVLARGNFDSLAFKMAQYAERLESHGSLVLKLMGVPDGAAQEKSNAA